MPKLPRRSSVNQNILNLSSDGDINSKRGWWKNLSDNSRRMSLLTNSQIHPDSYKVLNTDSTITEDQPSQWWRHLSENENVPSLSKVNLTGDKSTEDRTEKNLSQSESEEDEQIFTKKRLFASQEQRPQKSRYSKAFNLNFVKAIEEEQNAQEEKQNFKIEDDKNIESPGSKSTKGSKKRRKTKSIFSKKFGKRKYSDAFKFNEPAATEESNKNKKVEKEDSEDENISVTKESAVENPKEELFKLNHKKKRYSQAFVNDEPIEQFSEKQKVEKKNNYNEDRSNNHNQTTETPKIVEKVSLFKGSFKKKNYSEAFTVSKSKVLQDSESSEEEINIDEMQTQKHASFISNRSVNVTNKKKTPQKDIRHQNENITQATKSKTSVNQVLRSEMDDSESSEEEINIEEINTQKTPEKSINIIKEKKKLFVRNTRSKKYSEAFLSQDNKENENDEHEVEETKLDPSQHVKKSQTLRKAKDDSSDKEHSEEIKTQTDAVDKNINITNEKKNLFEKGTKIKICSQEFLSQDNDNKANDEYEVEETILDPSQHARKSQTINKDTDDSSDGENIEVIKTQKEMKKTLFKRDTRSKKYSEVFLGSSSSKIIQEENSSHSEKENNDNDTNQVSSYPGRQDLFKLQNKSRKYSQAFKVDDRNKENNQNEPLAIEKNTAMQRKESLENIKTGNTKHSQAFMELISMQKEIDEERARTAKQTNIENKYLEIHTNKSVNDIAENEIESDDTKLSSISSINIPAEIKHPLFRPKARKSLYSSRSVNKNDQSNISDQDPQKNLEQVKIRRISSKRYSLRSTSPADSGISKFFEESLISSTKLFINPNEDVLEGSAKKKRGKPPKSSSIIQENLDELVIDQKAKDNTYNNNTPRKRHSKSKSITIVPENPVNTSDNKIIYDNNNLGSEEQKTVQNKNISKKDPKSQFGTTASKIPDIHSEIKENNDLKSEESIKNKHSTSKIERKSKSVTSVYSDPENNTSKNKIIEDNQDSKTNEFFKNKSLIGDRESITKDRDNKETSESNNIFIKKKRGRAPKSTSTVLENIQENIQPEKEIISTNKRNTEVPLHQEIENISDDRDAESDEAVESKNTTSDRGRKSKVVSKIIEDFEISKSENEIPKNNKITESNEKIKKKKSRRPPNSISTSHENVANTSEKENSTVTILRKSLTRTDENETEANKIIETEAQVRKEKSSTKKSSVTSHELPVENISDNDMTEDKNEELDKLMKQKKIVSKIQKKINQNDNITPGNNNRKSSVINKSMKSSINNTKILYSSDSDTSLNNPENSREIPVEKEIINHALNISTSNQKQSSVFSKGRNYESIESLSNIITIHSSISRAQSSQFLGVNKNVENWLSQSFVEPAQNVAENKDTEEFLTTLNLEPRKSKKLFTCRRGSKSEQRSTNAKLKNKELLLAVKDILREKQNKPQTEIPVKKITDYFNKLDKNEKLKPIPKKTNSVKKTPHPVCTARLVNGKPYYAKKLFRGKQWCTPRFYKYLQNKMKDEYDDDTINESEKIMKYIVNSVQVVIKSKKYLKEEVDNLKKELARHKIIATTYDFFCFCSDFLPAEYRDLVVPMTRLNTSEPSVPYNEKDVFKQIDY